MDSDASQLILTQPRTDEDWERYYDLRWRILRAPWNQPRGSERDQIEDRAVHVMIRDSKRDVLAVGRLHYPSAADAQVRFMAVDPTMAGRSLGSRVLAELERRAITAGVQRIVLNARAQAIGFYAKRGYTVTGPAETLFGDVEHMRMEKIVTSARSDAHRNN